MTESAQRGVNRIAHLRNVWFRPLHADFEGARRRAPCSVPERGEELAAFERVGVVLEHVESGELAEDGLLELRT
jgi:hypothetical protein